MASTSATPAIKYRYSVEIGQMVEVLCGTKDAEDEVVQYIEDIVRTQLVEIFAQGRAQAVRRGSRYLAVEDLIFLIRHDRAKVNRLRTYLSWKDVRKKVKDSEADEAPEIETMEEPATDKALKVHKMKVKIPWDLATMYSEHLNDQSDTEDDDEVEAYEDSKKRLKDADELTSAMTREQYQHYAECRQASFTYRKAKRFREFMNFNAYTDGIPNDEVIDVLGFLAYEIVRTLCESASSTRQQMTLAKASATISNAKYERTKEEERERKVLKRSLLRKEKGVGKDGLGMKGNGGVIKEVKEEGGEQSMPMMKKRKEDSTSPGPTHRKLVIPTSLFSEPIEEVLPSGLNTPGGGLMEIVSEGGGGALGGGGGEKDQVPLSLDEVTSGFMGKQIDHDSWKSSGMKNWRSGGGGRRALQTFL